MAVHSRALRTSRITSSVTSESRCRRSATVARSVSHAQLVTTSPLRISSQRGLASSQASQQKARLTAGPRVMEVTCHSVSIVVDPARLERAPCRLGGGCTSFVLRVVGGGTEIRTPVRRFAGACLSLLGHTAVSTLGPIRTGGRQFRKLVRYPLRHEGLSGPGRTRTCGWDTRFTAERGRRCATDPWGGCRGTIPARGIHSPSCCLYTTTTVASEGIEPSHPRCGRGALPLS